MRSGPKPFEIKEMISSKYVPEARDYDKFLRNDASESDDNDVISDDDENFQKSSRKNDNRDPEEKQKIMYEDGALEAEMKKYGKTSKKLPKHFNKSARKMFGHYMKKQTELVDEADLLLDWA